MILVDTNILVHSAYLPDPFHAVTKKALTTLRQSGEILCVAPQNVVEFWGVVTRPSSPASIRPAREVQNRFAAALIEPVNYALVKSAPIRCRPV